jgi:hypothetical protein
MMSLGTSSERLQYSSENEAIDHEQRQLSSQFYQELIAPPDHCRMVPDIRNGLGKAKWLNWKKQRNSDSSSELCGPWGQGAYFAAGHIAAVDHLNLHSTIAAGTRQLDCHLLCDFFLIIILSINHVINEGFFWLEGCMQACTFVKGTFRHLVPSRGQKVLSPSGSTPRGVIPKTQASEIANSIAHSPH